jgi:hypothetical protein
MGSTTISIPTQVKIKAARCKHGNEDLFIFIDTHKTIYADSEERAPSDVHFYAAAKGMKLYFETNNTVFEKDMYTLDAGDNCPKRKGHGSTRYAIDTLPTATPTANRAGGDPIVVVP